MKKNLTVRERLNRKKMISDNLFVYSLIIYPLILWIIFFFGTNFGSIMLAFQRIDGTGTHFAGFENFKNFLAKMFRDGDVIAYAFKNTIIWYLADLIIGFFISIGYSYLIFRECLGHKAIRFIVLVPSMMSGLVVGLVFVNMIGSSGPLVELFKTFNINGGKWKPILYDQKIAMLICYVYTVWMSLGSALILVPNAMRGVNQEVIESARIDGINDMFREIWYIILPLIWDIQVTFWVTSLAGIFSIAGPLMAFYGTNAPEYTYLMGYYWARTVLVDSNEFSYPLYSAGGLILTAIVGPVTLFAKWALNKFGPKTE